MKRLIDIIIHNRVVGLVFLLLLTIFLGYEMLRVELNADFSTYLRQDDPLVRQFNLIGEEYAGKSMALVLVEADDVFSSETLKLVRDLTDAYEELDGIAYVTSLTNVLDFRKTEWGLEVGRLIRRDEMPETEEELKRLKDYVLSKEMYVKDLVSEDGKSTVIVTRLMQGADEFQVTKEIRRITESIVPEPENISFGGMPFLMYHMTLLIIENIERLEPAMILLMLGILFIGFRRAGGIFLPLAVVAFSVVWTVGLMTVSGISLNLLTGLMPIILVAMGCADGIHIMRRYYEKRQMGKEPVAAVKDTFSELGIPIIITTFTTMIGFLSLLISDFSVIQQFGIVTALGVFMALLVTFLLFPVLLSFSKTDLHAVSGAAEDRSSPPPSPFPLEGEGRVGGISGSRSGYLNRGPGFIELVAERVYRNKVVILIFSGLIVVAAAAVIPMIEKDVDWSLCLKKGSKSHRAEMLLRRDFGGTLPVQVLVEGRIKDPFTLKAMRYLERYLETVPSVAEAQSIAGVISEMNEVMNGRYVVPEIREGVANLWFLIEGEEIVEQMVREDGKEALIQAKLDTWHTGTMSNAVDKINRFIEGLPERLMIVELGKVSPEVRGELIRIRGDSITDNLIRDMERREIEVERGKLRQTVMSALFEEGLNEEGYGVVRQKIVDYLLSDEAEIESVAGTQAAAIAGAVVEGIRRNNDIGWKEMLEIAKSEIKKGRAEDMSELALSLDAVVSEAVGEARVTSALDDIRQVFPPGSEKVRDLFRDIKGDLWEMNENVIALSEDEFKGLPAAAESTVIKEVTVSFENTGLVAVLKKMEEELTPTQVMSLLVALVLVAITMGFMFRSLSLGIIGIIPITMTILVNFAVMGYFGIGLDSFTAMIASVAIGLGIDTDVHFISCFRREFLSLGDELKALKRTLSTTGVAILINALTVGLGFAVLLLAGGQHVRRFGGLVSLTVLLSAFFTFTVLPAVMMTVRPRFLREEMKG